MARPPETQAPLAGGGRSAGVDGNLTAGLDYLARSVAPHEPLAPPEFAAANRRLFAISGIGRDDKFGAALERNAGLSSDTFVLPTVGLLTGLHAFGSPLAFTVSGSSGRVDVGMGVWTARADLPPDHLDERAGVLAAVLRSLYPVVMLDADARPAAALPEAAVVLGIPSVIPPTPSDAVVPIDRAIRSLSTDDYRVVVLAQPLTAHRIDDLRDEVISEMRWVQAAAHAESLPSPLATDYLELLKKQLATMTQAASTGAWRAGVYLCGTASSLPRLESVWRSTFSGAKSIPEPVRVHRMAAAASWAYRWALPDVAGAPGSTYLRRPFELQTVLTSAQLAAYVHLPEQEAPGFAVDAVARFDSVVPSPGGDSGRRLPLGDVVHGGVRTDERMAVPLDELTKHVLVCGVTGSGKSTTVRHVLGELARQRVPFLVIEPAKAEYRAMTGLPELAGDLRVFTVGDEQVAPLRLNPLEAPAGVSVAMHIDLVKSLFSASFGLWPPLPQILERCLHTLYADYGWSLTDDSNHRLADATSRGEAFPTLSELHDTVERYIGTLGYGGEVTANMRAALSARLSGLVVGGKGRMLDTRTSTPIEELLDRPTVLELERLADPEDQAFLMGLLLIRLAEHRRAQGPSPTLRHVLVVEEAHRLLARVPADGETGSPRAKAVESFANLLAEVRSYGQGALVCDQVPVKLASEVIKNSNLKIAHRLVADDDRGAMASAMVMDERQRRALATLPPGQAAVFAEGQDAPVLLQMAPNSVPPPPSDAQLRAATPRRDVEDCRTECRGLRCCRAAETALTAEVAASLSRLAQTLQFDPGAALRLWPDTAWLARARLERGELDDDLRACLAYRGAERWARTRGARGGWSFADTTQVALLLGDAVLAGSDPDADTALAASCATSFASRVAELDARHGDPFPQCADICPDATCRHRQAASERLGEQARAGLVSIAFGGEFEVSDAARRTWVRAADLAVAATDFPSDTLDDATWSTVQRSAVATTLCLAQQAIVQHTEQPPAVRADMLGRVLTIAPRNNAVRPAPPSLMGDGGVSGCGDGGGLS